MLFFLPNDISSTLLIVHPVPVRILRPTEIQITWSQTAIQRKTKIIAKLIKVGKSSANVPGVNLREHNKHANQDVNHGRGEAMSTQQQRSNTDNNNEQSTKQRS